MPYYLSVIKKISLSLAFTGFFLVSFAQPPRFAIFAGPQMSSAKYQVTGVKQPTDYKFGFQAGLGMKIFFDNNLYFSPAAIYSLKGYKVTFNRFANPPDPMAADNNTSIHTFELAFLLQYDLGKNPQHFFIKAGPSLDFQLAGKEKFNLMNGNSVSRNMVYDFGVYGHYSANMLVQFGFETGGFMLFGQYSHGIANINNADNGPSIKHRVFGISIGKYFNTKKIILDTRNKE